MKIVIDISEEDYNEIEPFLNGQKIKGGFNLFKMLEMIKNGTPLPKNHGRLIDEKQIIDRFKPIEKFKHWRIGTDGLFNVLSDASTIIESEVQNEL